MSDSELVFNPTPGIRYKHRCTNCYNGRLFSKTISFLGGCLGGIIGFFSSKFFHG